MSIESNDEVVLVPLSQVDNEGMFAQAICRLGGGQQLNLTSEDQSLLVVTKSLKDDPRFQVEKVIISPSSCYEPSLEINEWRLGTPEELSIIHPNGGVNCIFLGPSIINYSLYGGQLPPGKDFVKRFGIISPEQDPDDGEWQLNITMPQSPYHTLSKLSIAQTL